MRIISRYISTELAKVIAICLGTFVAIYLVVDFFERIDDFLEEQLSLTLAGQYFLLKVPLIVQQGIPLSILMGTLIVLGLFARTNELTALKAGGVSPLVYTGPVVMVALVLSLVDFALAEYLVPLASTRANSIWEVEVCKRLTQGGYSQEKLWYKSGRVLYNIRVFHPKRQLLEGVTIYFFDDSFQLVERLDARRGRWNGEKWVFTDGLLLHRRTDGSFVADQFHQHRLQLAERPESFQHLEKAPEEMTLAELGRYIAKITSEGYDATRYRVDYHAKISFPVTAVTMALLAIGVAFTQGRRGGIAVGVALSIAIAFVYLLMFQLVLSLGYAGKVQPLWAAWVPNIFFAMFGFLLCAHARL
jgi:lipopolysaccharide export system permease protein